MSDENLANIVDVEYGGGVTLFRVKDDPAIYLVEDSLPLKVGYRVGITTRGRIGIVQKRREIIYPRVTQMEIIDEVGCRTRYVAKNIDLVTEYK